jgi:hypothetical protein
MNQSDVRFLFMIEFLVLSDLQVLRMEALLKKKVSETMADVFGVLFSISNRPLDDLPPRKFRNVGDSYIEVRIDISRGDRFPAYFFFPEELARGVAQNFMGLESSGLDDDKIKDVVSEAVRMTIGGLLCKIDPDARCTIGAPYAKRLDGFSPGHLHGAPGTCIYETEFGYLWMDLSNIDKCC